MKQIPIWLCKYMAEMGYFTIISNGEVFGFQKMKDGENLE